LYVGTYVSNEGIKKRSQLLKAKGLIQIKSKPDERIRFADYGL